MSSPTPSPGARLDPDELAALEEQRDFLLASLDDLDREHEAGDLDEHDFRTLHDDYTARAAEVLTALREHREAVDASRPPRRPGRVVAWVVGVAVVAGLAGFLVATTSGERKPGQTITGAGSIQQTAAQDVQRCVGLTQQSLMGGSATGPTGAIEALKCYGKVLDKAPDDKVAHAYRAWTSELLARQYGSALPPAVVAGYQTKARQDLEAALKTDDRYPDALVFSALDRLWGGDVAGARSFLARFDALGLPSTNEMVQLVDNLLRPQLGPATAGSTTTTTTAAGTTTTSPG